MRTLLGVVVVLLLSPSHPAFAQGLTPGKYSGTISFVGPAGHAKSDRIEIKIDKVEGEPSKGPSPTSARSGDSVVATFLSWAYLKATS